MSCDAIAVSAFLWLAATGGSPQPTIQAPVSVAAEPMFVDIVARASTLRTRLTALRSVPDSAPLPNFADFQTAIAVLSAKDLAGHEELKARGTDGDLKCILRGISQDLPKRIADIVAAPSGGARGRALTALDDLLRDNIEVIEAPPAPPV